MKTWLKIDKSGSKSILFIEDGIDLSGLALG